MQRPGSLFASMPFVYILRCSDGSLYTGYTVDLDRRIRQHQSGRGGRYTRTRTPVELVYTEPFRNQRAAMQREIQIKQLTRARKLALIEGLQLRAAKDGPIKIARRKKKKKTAKRSRILKRNRGGR